MPLFAGLDWGSPGHAVCVVDDRGTVILRPRRPPRRRRARRPRRGAEAPRPAAGLPVAIERPSGLVVETLVAAGHPVVPIHPNAVKACRPRYRAAGGKSDPGDAYLLADMLRTDGHRFPPLTPSPTRSRRCAPWCAAATTSSPTASASPTSSGPARGLLARRRRDLRRHRLPIALAFLGRFPTPRAPQRLGTSASPPSSPSHRYSGRRTPAELLARLRAAPAGLAGEAETDADGEIVRATARPS